MQRQNVHGRPVIRAPMLDLTNVQQLTFDNTSKHPVNPAPLTTKGTLQYVTARAYTTMDNFDAPQCSHSHKVRSANSKYWNCVDCGAFVSVLNTSHYTIIGKRSLRNSRRVKERETRDLAQCSSSKYGRQTKCKSKICYRTPQR